MPYARLDDLPESIQGSLPRQAQKIYLEAFNHAWRKYDQPGERRPDATREATCAKVAWAAVKKRFVKDENTGKWKEKK